MENQGDEKCLAPPKENHYSITIEIKTNQSSIEIKDSNSNSQNLSSSRLSECVSCAVEEVVVWPEGPLVSLVILRRSAMLAGAASHDVRNKQQCVNIRPSAVQSNTLRHASFMLLVPKADWCINR